MKRKAPSLKACLNCKLLVPLKVEICPNCSSRDFTEDWEGLIILLDPDNSEIAKVLEKSKPGKYALKVR